MNRRPHTDDRSWIAFRVPRAAQPANRLRIVLAASLLTGMGLAGLGQEFRNLDFEQASLVPASGPYTGEVEIGPALPGWSVFTQVPYVLYDNIFLDSAGVSILDTNWGAFQGKFMVVLEGGLSLSWPLQELSVAIAQTGTVPAWANTMLFDGWLMAPVGTDFVVSIAGESLPFYPLAVYTNYTLFGVDVSRFSGRAQELRFTANPHPPPSPAINIAYLDDIHFSSSPLSAPPLILRPPQSLSVDVGSSAQFTVLASGFPPPTYQWFFNGSTAITGADGPVLSLSEVQLSQTGSYTVLLSNAFGVVTSAPVTLTVVAQPPVILTSPFSRIGFVGTTVEFAVSARGGLPLSYQWYFDNRPIPGAVNPSLQLINVQPSQAGIYVVLVTNAFGAVQSAPVTLTVVARPPHTNPPAGTVVAWGENGYGESTVPPELTNVIAIAAGGGHNLALKADGTVVAWGQFRDPVGITNVPSGLSNVVALAGGEDYSLALREDGTVVAWGHNQYGADGVPRELSGVIAIAAGYGHSLALRYDETAVGWGDNYSHELPPPGLTGVKAIAAGSDFSVALKSDGTVFAWGFEYYDQTHVPAGLANVTAIAAGTSAALALKADGTVVAWGTYWTGSNAAPFEVPFGLANVVAIAAGNSHGLALKSDATIVAWGDNRVGQSTVPAGLRGVLAIAANADHSLALVANPPSVQTHPTSQTAEIGSSVHIGLTSAGTAPLKDQWFFEGRAISYPTSQPGLCLTNIQPAQAGVYRVVVTNIAGAVTSAPVTLSVVPGVERRSLPGLSLAGQPGSALNLETADAVAPNPSWVAFDALVLTNGSQWHFDLSSPLQAQRFYRAWQTNSSSSPPTLEIHMVPVLTLTGAMGSRVRVDAINQFGPTDAWFPLDTVTLTNTSQLYFDISGVGQPPRLWRIVPVP